MCHCGRCNCFQVVLRFSSCNFRSIWRPDEWEELFAACTTFSQEPGRVKTSYWIAAGFDVWRPWTINHLIISKLCQSCLETCSSNLDEGFEKLQMSDMTVGVRSGNQVTVRGSPNESELEPQRNDLSIVNGDKSQFLDIVRLRFPFPWNSEGPCWVRRIFKREWIWIPTILHLVMSQKGHSTIS